MNSVHLLSAYRSHRISPSSVWQGHVRTGFSEIGMRGRAPLSATRQLLFCCKGIKHDRFTMQVFLPQRHEDTKSLNADFQQSISNSPTYYHSRDLESMNSVHLLSAYRSHRISPSSVWQGHVRTGFSDEIGMRGRAPLSATRQLLFCCKGRKHDRFRMQVFLPQTREDTKSFKCRLFNGALAIHPPITIQEILSP